MGHGLQWARQFTGYVPLGQVREALRNLQFLAGATAPILAVRVKLNPDVAFRDYPRGAEVTLPATEARRIEERESSIGRVPPFQRI